MFMKKIILLLSLILMGFGVFSQTLPIDSRLYARYSEEELQNMLSHNPAGVEYKNWFLDNAYVVKQISDPESSPFPKLKYWDKETKMAGAEVTEYDSETFNVMEYSYDVLPKKSNAYLIGDTGYLLVFYSGEDLTTLFNEYRRANNENR